MRRFIIVLICCGLLVGLVPQAAEAHIPKATNPTTKQIYHSFKENTPTATGLSVEQGAQVIVSLTGEACFGSNMTFCDEHYYPDGTILFGGTERYVHGRNVGSKGASKTFVAPRSGPVYVMMYDSWYGDNIGGYTFSITVERKDSQEREVCLDGDDRIVTTVYSRNFGVAGTIQLSRALGGNLMLCVHTGSGKVYAKGFTPISEPGFGPAGMVYRPASTTSLINDPGGGPLDTVMYQSRVTFTPAGLEDPQLFPVDVTYQIEGEVRSFGSDKACFTLTLKTQESTGWATHVDEIRCTHMY